MLTHHHFITVNVHKIGYNSTNFVQNKISIGEDIPNSQLLRLIEGEEPLGILLKSTTWGVCAVSAM